MNTSNSTDKISMNGNAAYRMLVIGCGSVGRCALPLLRQLLINNLKPSSITVLDCVTPPTPIITWFKNANIIFENKCVEEESYSELLSQYLSAGDLLLDLAFNVSTEALVRWCHENDILYVNTTVDAWFLTAKGGDLFNTYPFDLFRWQEKLLDMQAQLVEQYGKSAPTAIVEHGANPGLVSHFVKQGLKDMARHILEKQMISDVNRRKNLEDALNRKDYARLAYIMGVKTIHIAERDSQATNIPRRANQMVNTWCPSSMCEESNCCAQLGWGTHEKQIPDGGIINGQPEQKWPPQRLSMPKRGMNVWLRSWVPSGPIIGMAVPHPESFSLADYLAIREETSNELLYQPSVYFVYLPCDSAVCSLHEWRMQNYSPLQEERVMCDDIVSGADELGILLLGGHEISAWWTGSVLDIDETRQLVPGQSATTLQVAIGAVAAVVYALRHRHKGVCFPEQIDTEEILRTAIPFLGTWQSVPVKWPYRATYSNRIPKKKNGITKHHNGFHNDAADDDDDARWQFSAFLVDLPNL